MTWDANGQIVTLYSKLPKVRAIGICAQYTFHTSH
jgi:hypothetical protein